jgi:hypothetical protein
MRRFQVSILAAATKAGKLLLDLAVKHPEAAAELGKAIADVASAPNPVERAKRVAMAAASGAATDEALRRTMGRSKKQ